MDGGWEEEDEEGDIVVVGDDDDDEDSNGVDDDNDDNEDNKPQPPLEPPNTSLWVMLSSLSLSRSDVAMNEPIVRDGGDDDGDDEVGSDDDEVEEIDFLKRCGAITAYEFVAPYRLNNGGN